MSFLNSDGQYFSGEKAPGYIAVDVKPSENYKLKTNWYASIPDVWELDLSGFKTSLIDKLNKVCGDKLDDIMKLYPKNEDKTWDSQIDQAKKWKALTPEQKIDNIHTVEYSCIFSIATGGVFIDSSLIGLVDQLAAKILRNRIIFEVFSGKVLNAKRTLKSDIEAATNENQLKILENRIQSLYEGITVSSIASELGV